MELPHGRCREYVYRELGAEHLPQIQALSRQLECEMQPDDFELMMEMDHAEASSHHLIGAFEEASGALVGYVSSRLEATILETEAAAQTRFQTFSAEGAASAEGRDEALRLSGARPGDSAVLVAQLTVDPAHRRRGVGSHLMRLVEQGLDSQVEYLWLTCYLEGGTAARVMYQALGFMGHFLEGACGLFVLPIGCRANSVSFHPIQGHPTGTDGRALDVPPPPLPPPKPWGQSFQRPRGPASSRGGGGRRSASCSSSSRASSGGRSGAGGRGGAPVTAALCAAPVMAAGVVRLIRPAALLRGSVMAVHL